MYSDIPRTTAPATGEVRSQPDAYELLQRSSRLAHQADVAAMHTWDFYRSAPAIARAAVDRAADTYENALQESPATPLELSDFFTYHNDGASGAFLHLLRNEESLRREFRKNEAVIEQRAEHEAANLMQAAKEVSTRIDYHKVIADSLKQNNPSLCKTALWIVQQEQPPATGQKPLLSELMGKMSFLTDSVEELKQSEVLSNSSIRSGEEELSSRLLAIREDAVQSKNAYQTLYNHYDRREGDNSYIERVLDILPAPNAPDSDHYVYNQPFAAAAAHIISQFLSNNPLDTSSEQYRSEHEKIRALDTQKILDNLTVWFSEDAREEAPFTEAELKEFLLENIPPLALREVSIISYRPITSEWDNTDVALGLHNPRHKTITVSSKIQNNLLPDRNRKDNMLYVITHEYGHSLLDNLPVAALHRWEMHRSQEPTAYATRYVEHRYTHGVLFLDDGHPAKHKEDFADSMARYIFEPSTLRETSPARFQAMQEIFEEYMPAKI